MSSVSCLNNKFDVRSPMSSVYIFEFIVFSLTIFVDKSVFYLEIQLVSYLEISDSRLQYLHILAQHVELSYFLQVRISTTLKQWKQFVSGSYTNLVDLFQGISVVAMDEVFQHSASLCHAVVL